MNRISSALPLHLLRPAIALLSMAVLVATVTATLATSRPAGAAPLPPAAHCGRLAMGATKKPAKPKKRAQKAKTKTTATVRGVVNINTATSAELRKLPGVGPSKADRVVAYRTAHGPFRRVVDLRRVKGFGRKTLARLEKHLTVHGPTTLAAR